MAAWRPTHRTSTAGEEGRTKITQLAVKLLSSGPCVAAVRVRRLSTERHSHRRERLAQSRSRVAASEQRERRQRTREEDERGKLAGAASPERSNPPLASASSTCRASDREQEQEKSLRGAVAASWRSRSYRLRSEAADAQPLLSARPTVLVPSSIASCAMLRAKSA